MFERNDDVLFVCYDNEGYMNTGVQRSAATPPAARTATTEAVGPEPGNAFGQGKDLPRLAMAHDIPYVATATVADLHDLERKVERAMSLHGARYLHVLVPCPLGWGSASRARRSAWRAWPPRPACSRSSRPSTAVVTSVAPIRRRTPVEEYLRPQRRYAHLFPARRRPDVVARLQAIADANIERYGLVDAETTRGAVTGTRPSPSPWTSASSRANHTGTWRVERPVYVDRLPPCNHACPAGEDIQGWLYLAEAGDYEAAWRHLVEANPLPAVMGRICFHPCETACNRAQRRRGGRDQRASSGSSATRRSRAAGPCRAPGADTGRRVLVVGLGPGRALGRLPPAPPRPRRPPRRGLRRGSAA